VICALSAARVEFAEVGYKTSARIVSRAENGAWRFCEEQDLRRILEGIEPGIRLAAMVDVGRIEREEIPRRRESALEMIRVACYAHQIEEGLALVDRCLEQGFETTLNLMAVSSLAERELDAALERISRSPVPTLYLVDSFGALRPTRIRALAAMYLRALPGRRIGIHAHNNLQLALANTLEAADAGATLLDATLFGMGRGAGNCPLELLLAQLRGPGVDLVPVLEVIERHFIPLKREVEWGYHLPFMITGALNEHPRAGIEAMAATGEAHADLYRRLRGTGDR